MDFSLILKHRSFLLQGAAITIALTLGSVILGLILGVIMGMGRLSNNRIYRGISGVYITILRGTPMLLQIFFIYFGIPQFYNMFTGSQMSFDAHLAGIIALGLNSGAYVAEIVRAGIQSVDKGQSEAARSLGLTHKQTMRLIILPQAFKRIIPPLANEFIVLLKDSSLVSSIGAGELMYSARVMGARYYDYVQFLIGAGVVYLTMTIIFSHLVTRLERRLAVSD